MTSTEKRIYDLTHQPRNGWDIAGEIAAEITDLQERNAFLMTSAETAQAQVKDLRERVARMAEKNATIHRLTILANAWEARFRYNCLPASFGPWTDERKLASAEYNRAGDLADALLHKEKG